MQRLTWCNPLWWSSFHGCVFGFFKTNHHIANRRASVAILDN
ncbi:Uncharacterised protein [Vibrio cholerae]|nr:Uncharacterised protein [Vibrio cholerae]